LPIALQAVAVQKGLIPFIHQQSNQATIEPP